jgi:L-ascorbate metabolism protein UlaG (beta-lactamase superfamily)
VRFGLTGPVRYSMTAQDAVELCRLLRPRHAVPVHYEGWSHFSQGQEGIARALAAADDDTPGAVPDGPPRHPGGVHDVSRESPHVPRPA